MLLTIHYVIIQKTMSSRKSEEDVRLSFLNPKKARSSRSQMFFKIGVFKNLRNFTGKHLCWSLFFKKLFPCEIWQIFKNTFFKEHSRWLLLKRDYEVISLVRILQSCHVNVFEISHRCFRNMSIKKNNE